MPIIEEQQRDRGGGKGGEDCFPKCTDEMGGDAQIPANSLSAGGQAGQRVIKKKGNLQVTFKKCCLLHSGPTGKGGGMYHGELLGVTLLFRGDISKGWKLSGSIHSEGSSQTYFLEGSQFFKRAGVICVWVVHALKG